MLLENSKVCIKRQLVDEAYGSCFIEIVNEDECCEYRSGIFETLPEYFTIPQEVKNGLHSFHIYFKSAYGEKNTYYDLFGPQNGIPFIKQGKCIEFTPSTILEYNKSFLSTQKECFCNGDLKQYLESSHMIQSKAPEIKKLAEELTRDSADTIERIKKIYFYVSRTLSYNKEALEKGSYYYTGQSATEALNNNKCVCQGFANLTVAMCRAIGIPSFSVAVIVKHSNKQWEELENEHYQGGNHQIALAWNYCHDRWVIMDPTWDNDQYYDTNGYADRHGNGIPYKYFDTTIDFISYTHRFVEILNI